MAFSLSGHCQHSGSWTEYRGPFDNGYSLANGVPSVWSESSNILWKRETPGKGWSSPVILDSQIWITSASEKGKELYALAYDLDTGKEIHNITVFRKDSVQESHPLNSYASPSPVIEKGRVYVHFGAYGTAAIDTESGKIIWTREDIICEHEVGPGSSPFIYQNLLILTMDGTDVQYIEALDKNTGKTIWKTPRGLDFTDFSEESRKAYSTPIISLIDGIDQLIIPGPHAVMAYDPDTGKQLWIVHYRGFSCSARPVIGDGVIFINTGFSNSSYMAVKLGGSGDLTKTNTIWENRKSLQARSSALYIEGLLYVINTGGQAKCLDAASGKVLWTKRVGRQTSSSPIYVDGKIYSFDEEGLCTIFKPGKSFMKVAENTLSDGCMASPAVLDNTLIVRTKSRLLRIGGR